jgi:tetratricopeptide (TPR) repeat protein
MEGGLTYYIKPLHELLSETPGQELLRDQRINYDSRLWDDVRGCGGYHTVTGVEDVERTILARYNTVLHELTHQVHGVLPAGRQREIQELYRRTKERDDAAGQAFLSRYAGGSVWEYFAEGANALYSPRRDGYDTREVVRERLQDKDPALRDLVAGLMEWDHVDSCYAPAYVGRGDEELQRGRPAKAVESYELALSRSPREEAAAAALLYARGGAGRAGAAGRGAGGAGAPARARARLLVQHAEALWFGGKGLPAAVSLLEEGRPQVREADRYQVDAALGRYRWILGDAPGARAAYEAVLAYQADNPEGLWGLAAAAALGGDWETARARYEEAVRLRTGVVDLRVDYARDLLRAGDVAGARAQVEEALLLDAGDPSALALRGWVELVEGKLEAAARSVEEAVEAGPWCDMAWIVRAKVEAARGRAEASREALSAFRERVARAAAPH